ncbi:MAG: Wzz/FepE/Etk N-terminal domain-containing protein [Verrucomicrobiota bacterium]
MKSKPSKDAKPPQGGINLRDLVLVVFRHKWKIILLALLGLGGAAAVHVNRTPVYASSSKLLVRYVVERSGVDSYESQTQTGGRAGGHVIDAEIEILTSHDLALDVSEAIGPERLLPDAGIHATPVNGSRKILGGLEVTSKRDSNVISVTYESEDPGMTVEVLQELVRRYFDMHLDIHRSVGAAEFVSKKAEAARVRLEEIDVELSKLKSEAGILSLTASGESLDERRGNAAEKLMNAEARLVEQKARVGALEMIMGAQSNDQTESDEPVVVERPDPLVMAKYEDLALSITNYRNDRRERLKKYKESDPVVRNIDAKIRQLEVERADMLKASPGLVMQAGGEGGGQSGPDLLTERSTLAGYEATVELLRHQHEKLEGEYTGIVKVGSRIAELERDKEVLEQKYRYMEAEMEKTQIDATLDPSKMPNISEVQSPSAPKEIYDEMTKKIVLGLAGGGLALGLGLAFLIELVLDRRIKAPMEIQTRLQVPLMMAIPYVRPKLRGSNLLIESPQEFARIGTNGDDIAVPVANGGGGGELSTRNGFNNHFVLPYAEAIRNRIIFNFELNKINHKPKLIALAGLSEGAGTSTIAAGLAKAFSDADNVKVLLVDLTRRSKDENGSANGNHHSLDGALKISRQTQFKNGGPSLHYARVPEQTNGNKNFTPLHLHRMLPEFRASDFDYIIFDMPEVDPTSPTLAMAGLMDKVLLVLDAEKTDREELQWGFSELSRGQADVSCVFNKSREAGPRWLMGEA